MKNYPLFLFILLLNGGLHSLAIAQDIDASKDSSLSFQAERIYAHLNSRCFLSGESLYFSIYCRNAEDLSPSSLSKIAYIEIMDAREEIIFQTKVPLENGRAHGDFFIPSSLNSGTYTLLIYTKWMRNQAPETYFQSLLSILNPFTQASELLAPADSNLQLDVQFFPEGGQFLENFENTLAFRVVNQAGKGIDFQGEVQDELGKKVLSFQPLHLGMGRFGLKPLPGKKYRALIRVQGKLVYEKSLPQTDSQTYNLQLEEKGNQIRLMIQSDLPPSKRKPLRVRVQNQKEVLWESRPVFENKQALLSLDRRLLSPGIHHIQLTEESGREICERLYFKTPENINPQVFQVLNTHAPRSLVQVRLDSSQLASEWEGSSYSVSVRASTPPELDIPQAKSALSYLLLSGELKGNIEDPHSYFTEANFLPPKALDNLMLCHGWRKILLTNPPKYLPDYRGHLISGTLRESNSERVIPNAKVYLTIAQKDFQFKVAQSNSKGRFYFNMEIEGKKELRLQTDERVANTAKIQLDQDFLSKYPPSQGIPIRVTKDWQAWIQEKSIQVQIENIYYSQKKDRVIHQESLRFYGTPDEVFSLDNYIRFPNMEDVLRENTTSVFIRKGGDERTFRVRNALTGVPFSAPAFILLDGVPIQNSSQILRVDPLLIERVETVHKPYFYGSQEFLGGIISLQSYSGDFSFPNLVPRLQIETFNGTQVEKQYFQPIYEVASEELARTPDFRSQIYWNPRLELSSDSLEAFSFYTSDQEGAFEIRIEGISPQGRALSWEGLFSVKAQ